MWKKSPKPSALSEEFEPKPHRKIASRMAFGSRKSKENSYAQITMNTFKFRSE
jgi:hypothetical protein